MRIRIASNSLESSVSSIGCTLAPLPRICASRCSARWCPAAVSVTPLSLAGVVAFVTIQSHGRHAAKWLGRGNSRIPPIARASGGAAGAEDAFVEAIELGTIFRRLQAFAAGGLRRGGLQPGLDRFILRVKMRHVGHEVFDHRHVRQRINIHVTRRLSIIN